ncbi:MAG: hypothetical protein JWN54_3509 [Mycobacterium sp.]|nr:hypothetical protein [Mycobacterium sp.]
MDLDTLRRQEYFARLRVNALRREVYQQADPAASESLLDELQRAEEELIPLTEQRAQAQVADPRGGGVIVDTERDSPPAQAVRGADTTGLDARVVLRMAQVPTSIYHLLSPASHPLVSCTVRNARTNRGTRRVRVTSFIEGYSARTVHTVEIPSGATSSFDQLPTLFPDRVREVGELTGATLNVLVEDLDGKTELHRTETIWLLARTAAPLAVMDPATGQWQDMSPYFGAFVTPNAPAIMSFLRTVAEHHPDRRLAGYQGDASAVGPQVRAVFDALKTAGITYINSVIAFSPDEGGSTQRVRLPRESLADKEANCIDGTVLVASLLEALSMSPAIVVVPGHAFLAWETWQDSGEWRYLETTMIGSATFDEACASAERTAATYRQAAERTGNPLQFRRRSLQELRSVHQITPME